LKKWQIILAVVGLTGLTLLLFISPATAKIAETELNFFISFIRRRNPQLSEDDIGRIAENILIWSEERNLDPYLVLALMWQESLFNPHVVGTIGERGLMQMSGVAIQELNETYGTKYLYEALFDIGHNIQAGTHYLYYAFTYPREYDEFTAVARYRTPYDIERSYWYATQVLAKKREILEEREKFNKE